MITSILSAAVSGLAANAGRVGASSNNLANLSTAGYKRTEVSTSTLVTGHGSRTAYVAGGVQTLSRQLADVQGLLAASTRPTDLAISGDGFFAVSRSPDGGETLYTRDGSFRADSAGNLVNGAGLYLKAYPTDANGNPTGALQPVNPSQVSGSADATTALAVSANLPANAAVGDIFSANARVFDSLGNPVNVQLEFENKGAGVYGLTVANLTDSQGNAIGPAQEDNAGGAPYDINVVFDSNGDVTGYDRNGDGTVDSGYPPGLYVQFPPTSGAADLNIALDLGRPGQQGGLTRLAGDFTLNTVESNGSRYGVFADVAVAADGMVSARFENGDRRPIARVPVATFVNPGGLQALSGNAWRATGSSGAATLRAAGSGGAGTVQGGAVELSTTDVGTEFVNMMVAQRAYSANLKVISTADDMARELTDILA